MKRYIIAGLVGVAVVSGYMVLEAGDGNAGAAMQMPATEVSVVTMQPQEVVLTQDLPGRVAAFQVAEIRPQVSGIIQKRLFDEGSMVEAGQPLYQIDAAPYQAAYDSAEADMQKAEANLVSAKAKMARYKKLVEIGGISRQEYDDTAAALAQAFADVAIAKAAVATAKINLEYTKVLAPIGGRIGQSNVTEGALVTANQPDALATVQQLDQVYVDVARSGKDALKLRQAGTQNVQLVVAGEVVSTDGQLQFSDVSVDPNTGTVLVRALFPNPELTVLPGMFVHARLETWRSEDALLVSQRAVTRQADGTVVVWVVTPENKAEQRVIQVGDVVGDKWLVTDGLAAGDKVIVAGTMKVQPGSAVTPVEKDAAAAAAAE